MNPGSRYITTPIFYVNDRPHIGHVYTTVVCDVWARFERFLGNDAFFLTGTDEHGLKVEKSAQARGITPQALADENAAVFQRILPQFGVSNDYFIRTTQESHERQVQAFVNRLIESGDVYLGEFEGWYDEGQEEYYTDTKAKELDYKSPVSKRPLARAKEHNYYFRLSAYQKRLEDFFAKNPTFVRPESRRNEVLGRLREGLQDVPISRTNFSWGIPMPPPAEPGHVVYVWVDALFNYITALGLGEPGGKLEKDRAKFWPATYHVIGKEILWFHAVIWPALLMALKIDTPKCVYAHSFWISEGQKMSKSLGNFIDLPTIERYLKTYGLDAWRYYLVTQGPLGAQDANFAATHFHEIYTSHLVNTVGNCPSRVTAMIGKYFEGKVPAKSQQVNKSTSQQLGKGQQINKSTSQQGPRAESGEPTAQGFDWPAVTKSAVDRAIAAMEKLDEQTSVEAALEILRKVDAYINVTEPFKVAKDPSRKDELATILWNSLEAVRIASLLLWAVMPWKMEELWGALGVSDEATKRRSDGGGGSEDRGQRSEVRVGMGLGELAGWGYEGEGGLKAGAKVQKVALFPRVEQSAVAVVGAGA